jgi:multiple sugar transport system substrate-binding protein
MKWLVAVMILTLILAGCGSGNSAPQGQASNASAKPESGNANAAKETAPAPVTLKFNNNNKRLTDEQFKLMIADPVKKKYPYITVEMTKRDFKDIQNIPVEGSNMDLTNFWDGEMSGFLVYDLLTDLRPYIKKTNFDLNRYQENMIEPSMGGKGEIYGVPYSYNADVLFYNKDLLDKFGVSYPKDGLTWDDMVDYGKKIYRVDNGTTYYGFNYDSEYRLFTPLSLGVVNEAQKKAIVNTDQWAKVTNMMLALVDAQGGKRQDKFNPEFLEKRVAAMGVNVTQGLMKAVAAEKQGLNWDVAQAPSWKERPNTFGFADIHEMGILKTSKHPDDAMKVIEVFLSDENQKLFASKYAMLSPMKGNQFTDVYAKEIPELQNKRLSSIFKSHPAKFPEFGLGQTFDASRAILRNHIFDVLDHKTDTNTALKAAEEEINQLLAKELAGK